MCTLKYDQKPAFLVCWHQQIFQYDVQKAIFHSKHAHSSTLLTAISVTGKYTQCKIDTHSVLPHCICVIHWQLLVQVSHNTWPLTGFYVLGWAVGAASPMMYSYTWNWLFGNIQNTLTLESSLSIFYNRWLQKIILRQWHLDSKSLNRDPYPLLKRNRNSEELKFWRIEEKSEFCCKANIHHTCRGLVPAFPKLVTRGRLTCGFIPVVYPWWQNHGSGQKASLCGVVFSVHAQNKMAPVEVN